MASLGRANRGGQSVFYCSLSKEPVFFEVPSLKSGDEIILSFWQTKKRMVVNNIGYTDFMFEQLGSKRSCPAWSSESTSQNSSRQEISINKQTELLKEREAALSGVKNKDIIEAISKSFMHNVGESEKYRYKLTTAIAELHLGEIGGDSSGDFDRFAGVMYPSVRMWGNGDNLALQPTFVDSHLELKKAVHVKVNSMDGGKISFDKVDSASQFNDDGNLDWLGRMPNWQLTTQGQEIKLIAKEGKDRYGDYESGKGGSIAYWEAKDPVTGKVVEPA